MRITLVRHAQPDWEPGGRAADAPGLTEHGFAQAECVAKRLGEEPFDHFYVSTMLRAQQTAAPLAEALGLEPEPHAWLQEHGLPSLEGRTPEQVRAYFHAANTRPLAQWWDELPEGGESFRDFHGRVSEGVESLLHAHRIRKHTPDDTPLWEVPEPSERTLIVAHQGTIAVLVSHLLGLPPEPFSWVRFASSWAGITRLHSFRLAEGSVWALERFNDIDHMTHLSAAPGDGRPAPLSFDI